MTRHTAPSVPLFLTPWCSYRLRAELPSGGSCGRDGDGFFARLRVQWMDSSFVDW